MHLVSEFVVLVHVLPVLVLDDFAATLVHSGSLLEGWVAEHPCTQHDLSKRQGGTAIQQELAGHTLWLVAHSSAPWKRVSISTCFLALGNR